MVWSTWMWIFECSGLSASIADTTEHDTKQKKRPRCWTSCNLSLVFNVLSCSCPLSHLCVTKSGAFYCHVVTNEARVNKTALCLSHISTAVGKEGVMKPEWADGSKRDYSRQIRTSQQSTAVGLSCYKRRQNGKRFTKHTAFWALKVLNSKYFIVL